jgi:tRNA (guanine37-N1)-methyltransferase
MRFDILTIFPAILRPFLETSLLGKARSSGVLEVNTHDIRDYADDKHKTVDDTPYGGGAGMVMKIQPIDDALRAVDQQVKNAQRKVRSSRTIVLSARGEQFTQTKARGYAKLDHLILICGRYEGIDQRVVDHLADEELSIGPYVLNGGEAAALVVLEAVARLVPGVIGNPASLEEESFGNWKLPPPQRGPAATGDIGNSSAEYPQYTKPEEYKGWKVPEVLLSGNHEEIRKWRETQRHTF